MASGYFVGSMPLVSRIYQPIQGTGRGDCDFTTFYNGVELVDDPFVNGEPATGPIRIDTSGSTNDAVTAPTTFNPALNETFSVNTTLLANVFSADVLFTFIDTTGPAYMRVQYIVATGEIYMESHDGTSTTYMNSDTTIAFNDNHDIGFKLSGDEDDKLINMIIDGVIQTDIGNLDFTGIIFDKVVIATSGNSGARLKLLLYNVNSVQLGNTNFVGRLPTQTSSTGNTFSSDLLPTPVVYTLSPQVPLTEYYPYFTTGSGWNDSYLVSDTQCAGNDLIIVDGIAITDEDGFAHEI
jgi:hypothetical protein